MNMNDLQVPDYRALVAFGKLGIEIMASRMLSLLALFGLIAIAAYSVYAVSWQGAVCVAIVAVFVFIPALRAETNRHSETSREKETPQ